MRLPTITKNTPYKATVHAKEVPCFLYDGITPEYIKWCNDLGIHNHINSHMYSGSTDWGPSKLWEVFEDGKVTNYSVEEFQERFDLRESVEEYIVRFRRDICNNIGDDLYEFAGITFNYLGVTAFVLAMLKIYGEHNLPESKDDEERCREFYNIIKQSIPTISQ